MFESRPDGGVEVWGVDPSSTEQPSIGEWHEWPWSLLGVVPAASQAAWAVTPVIIWHFQRAT